MLRWIAECNGCKFFVCSNNYRALKKRVIEHKQHSGHKVYITGQLRPKEVERCQKSGKTYLAAVGQLM